MRSRGDVIQVKVLGIMALIDEGNFSVFFIFKIFFGSQIFLYKNTV